MPSKKLAEQLYRRRARLVLAFTNVKELVPRTPDAPPDSARVAELMQRLQQMPHTFIRTPDIARNEFAIAIDAFRNRRPLRKIDPYVDNWWETMWRIPPSIYRHIAPREMATLNELTLSQQLQRLIGDARLLRTRRDHEERIRKAMADDRSRFGTSRGTIAALTGAVQRYIEWWDLPLPKEAVAEFVKFIRNESLACPAWRVGFDAWEEFRCNLGAVPEENDIADFSHVQLLPYVTHLTLDRAWRTRCEQARDRLKKNGSNVEIYNRLYPSLNAIVSTW